MRNWLLAASALTLLALPEALAQQAGGGGAPAQTWWVEKTAGGVYKAPMKPIWRLADLKKAHATQTNWSEQIIKDPEQDVTYNGAKAGYKVSQRVKPDTATVFVVIAGNVDFSIEGQSPVSATRGSIVSVPKTTIYSADVKSDAYWVEINPTNYKVLYPSAEPQPKAKAGGGIVKVAFNHTPGAYKAPNKPHWNLFTAIDACESRGARALDDHIFVNPLITYPPGHKCTLPGANGAAAAQQASPPAKPDPSFNPKSTFGHMHAGPAEWWIVQSGGISGKFENMGEFHAVEGDVLYAAPMTWHQMGLEGPGPNVRTAMGGYNLINMGNTAGGGD